MDLNIKVPTDLNVDLVQLQKMAFIYNALETGWTVKKIDNQFLRHLTNELQKYVIWESVFRIRFSKGWTPGKTLGNFSVKSNDLLTIFNCDENHTLLYQFE